MVRSQRFSAEFFLFARPLSQPQHNTTHTNTTNTTNSTPHTNTTNSMDPLALGSVQARHLTLASVAFISLTIIGTMLPIVLDSSKIPLIKFARCNLLTKTNKLSHIVGGFATLRDQYLEISSPIYLHYC
jgi:hypothetical protein